MLVMRPNEVRFGPSIWSGVERIMIESQGVEMTEEWDDLGPNQVFADATRRRVSVRVVQELSGSDLGSPDPGELEELTITLGKGNDANTRTMRLDVVVTGVSYSFAGSRSSREIRLVAISPEGDEDPITTYGGA